MRVLMVDRAYKVISSRIPFFEVIGCLMILPFAAPEVVLSYICIIKAVCKSALYKRERVEDINADGVREVQPRATPWVIDALTISNSERVREPRSFFLNFANAFGVFSHSKHS